MWVLHMLSEVQKISLNKQLTLRLEELHQPDYGVIDIRSYWETGHMMILAEEGLGVGTGMILETGLDTGKLEGLCNHSQALWFNFF